MAGFDRLVGQDAAKALLRVAVDDARARGAPLEHVNLSGPCGLGKTTIAEIIATEMGGKLGRTAGRVTDRNVLSVIDNDALGDGDCLFMDEIHALFSRGESACAWLLSAMTDQRVGRVEIPRLTFIFATHVGVRSEAFRSRALTVEIEPLTHAEATEVIVCKASLLRPYAPLSPAQRNTVARAGNRNPREMIRIVEHVAKLARRHGDPDTFPGHDIELALRQLGLSRDGLGARHRAYLARLLIRWEGGLVGLKRCTLPCATRSSKLPKPV